MPLQLLVFSLTILLIVVIILRFIPNRVLKSLGRIYLLRVPLLTAIGLVAFCGSTWKGGTRSLLGGIFDVGDSLVAVFFVSYTVFIIARVVMATWQLVRLYGHQHNPDLDDPGPERTSSSRNLSSLA
jgi:hypothetical protein